MDENDNKKHLKAQVYDYLKEKILYCDLPPGSILTQDLISEQLKISRTPIREALLQLQSEGYVSIVPNKYIQISKISISDLEYVYDARIKTEIPLIRSFTNRKMEKHNDALYRIMAEWESLKTLDDDMNRSRIILTSDYNLHKYIFSISENPYLIRFLTELMSKSQRFWYYTMLTNQGQITELINEHQMIISYLIKGEYDSAADFLEIHFLQSLNQLGIVK